MKEYKYKIDGKDFHVVVNKVEDHIAKVEVNGKAYEVEMEKKEIPEPEIVRPVKPAPAAKPKASAEATRKKTGVQSPLPGVILDVKVAVGDKVKRGQTVLILEAMKMENNIPTNQDGVVTEILVNEGDSVLEGVDLIIIE